MTKTVVDLRNAIYDRLTAAVFAYQYKTTRKTPLPTLQEEQLPALGVYVLDGDFVLDGDGNEGDLRFIDDDTIAISVVRAGDMPPDLEIDMAAEFLAIRDALFCDAEFTAFGPEMLFESVPRQRRRWLFPSQGDQYWIELRYEITFRRRSRFEPVIMDDFTKAELVVRQAGSDPDAPPLRVTVIEAQ